MIKKYYTVLPDPKDKSKLIKIESFEHLEDAYVARVNDSPRGIILIEIIEPGSVKLEKL